MSGALGIERKVNQSDTHNGHLYSEEFMLLVDNIDEFVSQFPEHTSIDFKNKLKETINLISSDTSFAITGDQNDIVLNKKYVNPNNYDDNMVINIIPNFDNSGPMTIKIGELPPKSLLLTDGSSLPIGSIKSKRLYTITYDADTDSFFLISGGINIEELDNRFMLTETVIRGGTY